MKVYNDDILHNVVKASNLDLLPKNHYDYLIKLKNDFNFIPKTIYDIGSCVLHWTKKAQEVWPDSKFILFDATDVFEVLYKENKFDYHIGVLSDKNNKIVNFYQNNYGFAGNSYYKENSKYSVHAEHLYDDSKIIKIKTKTLDTVFMKKKIDLPDLIKIDTQGSELDILMGSRLCLNNAKHLLIELRNVEYNIGSPEKEIVINYLKDKGFKNMGMFCDNGPDADYHFMKI